MWQKTSKRSKYHYVIRYIMGATGETLCGKTIAINDDLEENYVFREKACAVCHDVWRIIKTSVGDAQNTLRYIDNLKVLRIARKHAVQVTLCRMIDAKIKKLEKENASI